MTKKGRTVRFGPALIAEYPKQGNFFPAYMAILASNSSESYNFDRDSQGLGLLAKGTNGRKY